jgi:hypothetical protein
VNRMTQASSIRMNCRVYATLLLLYPSTLRRQFGEEMIEVFAEQLHDACKRDGWSGGVGVWWCVTGEALRTSMSSHLQIVGISLVSGLAAFSLMCTFFWAMHL